MATPKSTTRSSAKLRAVGKPSPTGTSAQSANAPDRHRRIEERAYYKAAQRGFSPGMEIQDWLEAEIEEDEETEEA